MCETCRVQQYPFAADQAIMEPDWEVLKYFELLPSDLRDPS